MSEANHDPDFVLAEGTHQMALLCLLIRMITVKNEIINTILNLYRISQKVQMNQKEEAIDILSTVVSEANYDPDFDLAEGFILSWL